MKRTTVAVVTALRGRPRLTRAFLDDWARLAVPGVDLVRIAVCDHDDETETPAIAMDHASWSTIFHDQARPRYSLSDKFNAGFHLARYCDVDAAVVVGSDDFCDLGFVAALLSAYRAGHHYVVPEGLYALDDRTREAIYCHEVKYAGPGRLLSADLLSRFDWRPYPGGDDYVNGNLCSRVQVQQAIDKRTTGRIDPVYNRHSVSVRASGVLVDVKTKGSKNPWSWIRGLPHEKADAAAITKPFPHLRTYLDEVQRHVGS